jgi:hypothetical protein
VTQSFDRRKALETFGTWSAFSRAIESYAGEVDSATSKVERALDSLDRTELISALLRLESGLRYLHAGPALTAIRNLRARVRQTELDWVKVGEEVVKLRQKLSTLLNELRDSLGSRTLYLNGGDD